MTDARTDVNKAVHALCSQLDKALAENAALTAQLDKNAAEANGEHPLAVALAAEQSRFRELEADMRGAMAGRAAERAERMAAQELVLKRNTHIAHLEEYNAALTVQAKDARNTVAHLRAQGAEQADAISLLEEDNAALDARVGELLKAPSTPDYHPVGSTVYCRHTAGVRKSKIDSIRLTIGGESVITHYFVDGSLWAPESIFLTADEAFASKAR